MALEFRVNAYLSWELEEKKAQFKGCKTELKSRAVLPNGAKD